MRFFKVKKFGNRFYTYLFSIRIYSNRNKFWCRVMEYFLQNKKFNLLSLDTEIEKYVDQKLHYSDKFRIDTDSHRIAVIGTEYYDSGGHSLLAVNLTNTLCADYEVANFIINLDYTRKKAPKRVEQLAKLSTKLTGSDYKGGADGMIDSTFRQICKFNPRVLFVLIHMDDMYGAAIMNLVSKFTKTKVVFINHGSHYPALGLKFADLVLEGMPTTHFVTKHYRGVDKCSIVGLFDQKLEDIVYFSEDEKNAKRRSLGIVAGMKFTLTGGASYKMFNEDCSDSEYFVMIKSLLERNHDVQHVVMSDMNETQMDIVNHIFEGSEAKERLIFTNLSSDYNLVFQSCDLFIDSFPVSAALTQVELMKWRVPTVVKINRDNAMFSFYEYFPVDYKYMFEKSSDMLIGIEDILRNKSEQLNAVDQLYAHYCRCYEATAVKSKFINIIENADNLEQLYDKLDASTSYKLDINRS